MARTWWPWRWMRRWYAAATARLRVAGHPALADELPPGPPEPAYEAPMPGDYEPAHSHELRVLRADDTCYFRVPIVDLKERRRRSARRNRPIPPAVGRVRMRNHRPDPPA